eukprot:TRINITY_DN50477_c0_g1_i1.p1 TRINITY_DN50477_c0_g1~~TRINITY_DN50477_c0_g1_i1.p1  ORF type:complete len:658 (-),score=78.60 TRINITY_DN50477_c0_g1_i1:23-1996(-)
MRIASKRCERLAAPLWRSTTCVAVLRAPPVPSGLVARCASTTPATTVSLETPTRGRRRRMMNPQHAVETPAANDAVLTLQSSVPSPVSSPFPPGLQRLAMDGLELAGIVRLGHSSGPVLAYEKLTAIGGALELDSSQADCAATLQRLWEAMRDNIAEVTAWRARHEIWQAEHANWLDAQAARQAARSAPSEHGGGGNPSRPDTASHVDDGGSRTLEHPPGEIAEETGPPEPVEPLRPTPVTYGCYIWGGVGGGKSFLMDLFAECCGPRSHLGLAMRRVHFHEFMLEVHKELHELRKSGADKTTQAIARRIASEVSVLAFDEFQITNISDALIVETLFDALFTCGVSIVMTSNRPPQDLYKDGLNRHLAIPQFLALLDRRGVTFQELLAARDFRVALQSVEEVGSAGTASTNQGCRDFVCKKGGTEDVEARLRTAFADAAGVERGTATEIPVAWGRRLAVPEAALGVGCFSFSDLCCVALNADDYLHVAAHFHTIILTDVPQFSLEQHNESRRFTNLVDCLYERHARLIVSADVTPELLLESMATLSSVTLPSQEAERSRAGAVSDSGSSDWIRSNPFSPEPSTVSEVVRSAASPSATVKAGDDDTATGAGVAGVMAGALGSLQESGFAARRATSRLLHMQTDEYLLTHRRHRHGLRA